MRYFLLIIVFCFGKANAQTSCDTYRKNYVPKDVDDAVNYLACIWTKADKDSFKVVPEKLAVARLHFGTGLYIRNGWGLWKGRNELVEFFNAYGISHPDDMSSIILTSFHRYLNGKEIDLAEQIKVYQEYWDKAKAERDKHNKMYQAIKNGDTVRVMFSKSQATRQTYSLAFLSYNVSENDPNRCFVEGVVFDKHKKKGNRVLTIRITQTTNCDNSHLGDVSIITGQKFKYDMTYFNLTLSQVAVANKRVGDNGAGHGRK